MRCATARRAYGPNTSGELGHRIYSGRMRTLSGASPHHDNVTSHLSRLRLPASGSRWIDRGQLRKELRRRRTWDTQTLPTGCLHG
jgi:hypothetical protein